MAIETLTETNLLRLARSRIQFLAGWRHHVPAGSGAFHGHEGWELVYHASGSGRSLETGNKAQTFTAGSVDIYPPELLHTQEMDTAGEDVCVVVAIAGHVPAAVRKFWHIADIRDKRLLMEIASLARPHARMTKVQHAIWDCRAAGVFLSLLELARRTPASATDVATARSYAEEAFRIIGKDYRSITSLTDVAGRVGVSSDYLRHVFKAQYGVGLKEFLIQTRLERAEDLLRHSPLPMKVIAGLCGFDTERYFCTSFRRQKGVPPATFRKHLDRRRNVDGVRRVRGMSSRVRGTSLQLVTNELPTPKSRAGALIISPWTLGVRC